MAGCAQPKRDFTDVETPPEVDLRDFPHSSVYHIRTRIVIEVLNFRTDDQKKVNVVATNMDNVRKDLKFTEELFAHPQLRFEITETVYREYQSGTSIFFDDADKYPDSLSIYYILLHDFPFSGLSSYPWETHHGIIIDGSKSTSTVAHEIGHYFGLLHTFNHDYCDDTAEQTTITCYGDINKVANCGNLMSYCLHEPKFLTPNQYGRVERFLRTKRRNLIIPDQSDSTNRQIMIETAKNEVSNNNQNNGQ